MNKSDFLNHLSKRLQVLKQNERDDLLAEYTQHIELKIASGLGEEEAIRHFGDVDELADELLDAYHVNPDYGKSALKNPLAEVGGKVSGVFGSAWKAIKSAVHCIGSGCVRLFRRIGTIGKSDKKVKEKAELVQEARPSWKHRLHLDVPKRWKVTDGSGKGKKMCVSFMKGLKRILLFCWKLCVAAVLVPIVGCDFLAIILLGTLIVVILLGYPLVGVALMTLGSLLCGITLVWLVWLVVFGKKEEELWESKED